VNKIFTSALVLAAGSSSRMKLKHNKVLCSLGRERTDTVLGRLLKSINNSTVDEIIVVTGFQHRKVKEHIEGDLIPSFQDQKKVKIAHNSGYRGGMAVSFSCAAGHIAPESDAFLLFLGDQPLVKTTTICKLIKKYETLLNEGKNYLLVHPRVKGKKGHPVLFSSVLREEVIELGADDQPRDITWKYRKRAYIFDVSDQGIGSDIDTLKDILNMRKLFS